MSERGAALGIAALFAVVCSLDWHLARAHLGRFCGGALVLALAFGTDWITAGGYADGLLRLLLVGEFLAFASGADHRQTAWIAAACASLMKAEGFVFAFLIATAFFVYERGPQRGSLAKRALPFLVFGPALAHLAYLNSLEIDTLLRSNIFRQGLEHFIPRLGDVLLAVPALLVQPSYTKLQPALWQGMLGAIGLLYALARRQKPSAAAALAALLALTMFCFAIGSISALPEDTTFLVTAALDRLLLHPAAFVMLAALLELRSQKTSAGLVAEGDKVFIRATMKGTHKGEFIGLPASGKQMAVPFADIVRFEGGRVVEHWGITDTGMMMRQLS
jgi:hypothetical protein